MLRTLKIGAVIIGFFLVDIVLVSIEFAGSRWALKGLAIANPWVMALAIVLLPFAAFRGSRQVSGVGLSICAAFFILTFLALSFVAEADLGGLFGPILAFLSAGFLIPPLVIITAIGQGEWGTLWQLLGELAMAIAAYGIAAWCSDRSERADDRISGWS